MGIYGIGIDKIEIERIKQSFERFEERFIEKIYTTDEYILAKQRGIHRRLAMFFAAKEATSKALGTGFIGFGMKDIEVVYLSSGKPEIRLHHQAKQHAKQCNIQRIHLSLTDDAGTAMAFAIAEIANP